jgi:hypothetical protein
MVDFLFFCAANDVSHPILDRQRGEWPETLSRHSAIKHVQYYSTTAIYPLQHGMTWSGETAYSSLSARERKETIYA